VRVVQIQRSAAHLTLWDSWRDQARMLLRAAVRPEDVTWSNSVQQASLFADANDDAINKAANYRPAVTITKAFLELARSVAAHRDGQRSDGLLWALLYRLLWRQTLGGEPALLAMATDPDVRQAGAWAKAVGRDIHKMHAFVRFRLVDHEDVLPRSALPEDLRDARTGRECFVAWFEPDHNIVRLAAPFFQRRFAAMNWSILTPDECAHWQGEALSFSAGVNRESAPSDDALDDLWRSYYRSIFNPARLKINAMQSEMPKKYWKNLPEAQVIEELIADSQQRTAGMLATKPNPVKPAPNNAYLRSLQELDKQSTEDLP
jgi:uracil-DNA glycosylase